MKGPLWRQLERYMISRCGIDKWRVIYDHHDYARDIMFYELGPFDGKTTTLAIETTCVWEKGWGPDLYNLQRHYDKHFIIRHTDEARAAGKAAVYEYIEEVLQGSTLPSKRRKASKPPIAMPKDRRALLRAFKRWQKAQIR